MRKVLSKSISIWRKVEHHQHDHNDHHDHHNHYHDNDHYDADHRRHNHNCNDSHTHNHHDHYYHLHHHHVCWTLEVFRLQFQFAVFGKCFNTNIFLTFVDTADNCSQGISWTRFWQFHVSFWSYEIPQLRVVSCKFSVANTNNFNKRSAKCRFCNVISRIRLLGGWHWGAAFRNLFIHWIIFIRDHK